jgi:hypothetical protein
VALGAGQEETYNMAFTMTSLLIHSYAVPGQVRETLRRAHLGPPERREAVLESAARVLYLETDLECSEARELVGLPPVGDCT